MTGYRPPLDSDNESDEDTSHSLRQNILKGMHHPSDTESSDERHAMAQSPISSTKYNKEFRYMRTYISFVHCILIMFLYICLSLLLVCVTE